MEVKWKREKPRVSWHAQNQDTGWGIREHMKREDTQEMEKHLSKTKLRIPTIIHETTQTMKPDPWKQQPAAQPHTKRPLPTPRATPHRSPKRSHAVSMFLGEWPQHYGCCGLRGPAGCHSARVSSCRIGSKWSTKESVWEPPLWRKKTRFSTFQLFLKDSFDIEGCYVSWACRRCRVLECSITLCRAEWTTLHASPCSTCSFIFSRPL